MPITRVKTWAAGEVLTAADLNNEFNNLANNAVAEPVVFTQSVDLNGKVLILDDDGNTTLDALVNNTINLTINGASDFTWTPNAFNVLSGSQIAMASGSSATGDFAMASGRILQANGTTQPSAATVTPPTNGNLFDISGIITITGFATTQAGSMFYARFTGAGLDLTHNGTSFISPWGRDYKTIPNEVMAFWSLGSGNYIFWSINGPKERVGVTIEANVVVAPAGYLEEDGTSYLRTAYPGLYQEIGTTFGAADGSHFNVPDSLGRVSINVDGVANRITGASTNGGNADTLGGVGGAETHTLVTSETPVHTHTQQVGDEVGGSATLSPLRIAQDNQDSGLTNGVDTGSTGGGGAHSNTQPWIAKKKYIRF